MTVEPEATEDICADCEEPLDLHCDDCGECSCDGSCVEEEEDDEDETP